MLRLAFMKIILLLTLFYTPVALAGDSSDKESDKEGNVAIAKFELSAIPAEGEYGPWHDVKQYWYAGEITTIPNGSFRYTWFSDAMSDRRPQPPYSGPLKVFSDHIYLDHPGVCYPYRVAGKADGTPVIMTWEGYEQWKKTKKVFELNILWLVPPEKASKKSQ
jgi:hypothetical protein